MAREGQDEKDETAARESKKRDGDKGKAVMPLMALIDCSLILYPN